MEWPNDIVGDGFSAERLADAIDAPDERDIELCQVCRDPVEGRAYVIRCGSDRPVHVHVDCLNWQQTNDHYARIVGMRP